MSSSTFLYCMYVFSLKGSIDKPCRVWRLSLSSCLLCIKKLENCLTSRQAENGNIWDRELWNPCTVQGSCAVLLPTHTVQVWGAGHCPVRPVYKQYRTAGGLRGAEGQSVGEKERARASRSRKGVNGRDEIASDKVNGCEGKARWNGFLSKC
jgi:hypothetical protein